MEPERICRGQVELDAIVVVTCQLFLGRTGQTCVCVHGPSWDVTRRQADRRRFISSYLFAFVSVETRFERGHVNLHTNR